MERHGIVADRPESPCLPRVLPDERINADFRGGITCRIDTQEARMNACSRTAVYSHALDLRPVPPKPLTAPAFPAGRSDQDRHRDRDDRFRLLPEMKQPKARRRVGRAFPPDIGLESRICDINYSTISHCHEQPISGAKWRPRGMLPFSANQCHARRTSKKPEKRARSRDRQPVSSRVAGKLLLPRYPTTHSPNEGVSAEARSE